MATVTRTIERALEVRAAVPLHAAVGHRDVALLGVHIVHEGRPQITSEIGAEGDKEPPRARSGSKRSGRRIPIISQVMVTSQEHPRVGLLRVNANEVANVQIVGV